MPRSNKIIVFALVAALSACGFQPLYGKKQSADDNTIIQQVRILPMGERVGQILYNSLNDLMNPYGNPGRAAYELGATITTSTSGLGVRADESTTRQNSTVTARFTLRHSGEVTKFSIRRITGYNSSSNAYATNVAKNNAIRRNLEEIAQDAKIRIAALIKRKNQG